MLKLTILADEKFRMYKVKILWFLGLYILFSLWAGGHITIGISIFTFNLQISIGKFNEPEQTEGQSF